MRRLSEFDSIPEMLDKLTQLENGKSHLASRKVIEDAANILPSIVKEESDVNEQTLYEHVDRLGLHGRLASIFHDVLGRKDITRTAAYIFCERHGLEEREVQISLNHIRRGKPHGLNVEKLHNVMVQFFKTDKLQDWDIFPSAKAVRPKAAVLTKKKNKIPKP